MAVGTLRMVTDAAKDLNAKVMWSIRAIATVPVIFLYAHCSLTSSMRHCKILPIRKNIRVDVRPVAIKFWIHLTWF